MSMRQENQEEKLFRCPRCNNQVKLPTTFNIVHCPKCDAKLQVQEMKCLIETKQLTPRWDEQARWKEYWIRSKDIFVFDITPLSEPVDDIEQAIREEVLVCPICGQELKVKVQPEYQLSDKGRKKLSRKGWRTIGIGTIICTILFFLLINDPTVAWVPFVAWIVIIINGISSLNEAAPKKVFPSSLWVDGKHSLISPGAKLQQEQ
jgi:transcription elongation factor Elf1